MTLIVVVFLLVVWVGAGVVVAGAIAGLLSRSNKPGDPGAPTVDGPQVRVDGQVLMVSHDALHHPVGAHVTAIHQGRLVGAGVVDEENRFAMQIPAAVRGESAVSVGLHGASTSLVEADGQNLDVVVIYNAVNNFFA